VAVPVHLRAEPGDYASACLLPGDPARAQWLAETFLEGAVLRNSERGLLGYTGEFEGKPVSIQATGMGTPSAAIVVEELVQLGVERLLRIGTCGAVHPRLALGELVLALTAVPSDGTTRALLGGEPHCPTADWDLLHGIVHAAKELGQPVHVGPIASSDLFYNPDATQYERWASRGVLAVEMESAVLYTLAALHGVQAGTVLVVSDELHGGRPERIGDDDLRAAVERMAMLALRAATGR
jgi:DeoD family purine-nucleoside phosphorylase